MAQTERSGCPINLALEQLGDRWSLIVIRDVMFGNRRTFGELLGQSEEGIATNIPLHRDLFSDSAFINGGTNIHYLEKKLGL